MHVSYIIVYICHWNGRLNSSIHQICFKLVLCARGCVCVCVLSNLVIWCVLPTVKCADVMCFCHDLWCDDVFTLISFSLISVLSSPRLGNNHSSNRGNSPTPQPLSFLFTCFPFLLTFHSALASLMLAVCHVYISVYWLQHWSFSW